ncbi:MAG: cobyrinate a,c-diamide synthase [Bacilli bacterium]
MNRVMLVGTSSGVGKTTVVCGILNALQKLGKEVVSFKCGPDYIDGMFHKKVSGINSRNLDEFLMTRNGMLNSLINGSEKKDIVIIEGAMGMYDGMGFSCKYSANEVALITKTPTILIVNPSGKGISICAQIKGFLEFRDNNINAIILNNVKVGMVDYYKRMIKKELDLDVVGFLPKLDEAEIGSRHLGLISANEIKDIQDRLDLIGENVLKYFDLEKILAIASSSEELICKKQELISNVANVTIGVAYDEAFNFIYDDNLEILKNMGATIKFFSPLNDSKLPSDLDGILLFGGYPEIFAKQLENNIKMRESIINSIKMGMIVYAECGGFMYLHNQIVDGNNNTYKMLGIIDGEITVCSVLQNFGYTTLKSTKPNNFMNGIVNAHSFHYSKSNARQDSFIATKVSNQKEYPAVYTSENIFASYLHIHYNSNLDLPKNIIINCQKYRRMLNETKRN